MQVPQFGRMTLKQFNRACAASGGAVSLRDNQTGDTFVADSYLDLYTTNNPVVFTRHKLFIEGLENLTKEEELLQRHPFVSLEDKGVVSKVYETQSKKGLHFYAVLMSSLEDWDLLDPGKITKFFAKRKEACVEIPELDIVG